MVYTSGNESTQVCGNEKMECACGHVMRCVIIIRNVQSCCCPTFEDILFCYYKLTHKHIQPLQCVCVCVCVCACMVVMDLTSALCYITHAMCHILIYTVLLQGQTQLPRGITNCKC